MTWQRRRWRNTAEAGLVLWVSSTKPVFSARVGLGYRALGVREGDAIVWFWIGTHAEYDQLISSL